MDGKSDNAVSKNHFRICMILPRDIAKQVGSYRPKKRIVNRFESRTKVGGFRRCPEPSRPGGIWPEVGPKKRP